jgi:threonine/homoserine/homoserine lactone efflux protein
MFGIDNLSGFIVAALVVVATPGVDTIMVLTRSISKGKKAGLYSALGVSLGLIFHTAAVTFGLSLFIAKSAIAFSILKYLGAAYLVYLGYKSLTAKGTQLDLEPKTVKIYGMRKMFFTAFMSDVLNPKIALFFLAFLPQFIPASESNNPVPYAVLGCIMFVITLLWCSFLALTGARVARLFTKYNHAETWMNRTAGTVFILLGLKIALTKK